MPNGGLDGATAEMAETERGCSRRFFAGTDRYGAIKRKKLTTKITKTTKKFYINLHGLRDLRGQFFSLCGEQFSACQIFFNENLFNIIFLYLFIFLDALEKDCPQLHAGLMKL